MRIVPINNIHTNSFKQQVRANLPYANSYSNPQKNKPDAKKKSLNTSLLALAGISLLAITGTVIATKSINRGITPYTKMMAKALSEYLNTPIKPKQLKSVISGKELLNELGTLKKENYIASVENIRNGIFRADLHSHSNFSDGKGDVKTILGQVAEYADHVKQKTGKNFIYALTDHDTTEGVKEALTIIARAPEKFKNVKFVTGAEMSFAIKSDKTTNPYETIEVLVYGFNPFDKKIDNHIHNLQNTRKNQAKEYIEDLKQRFGYADFSYEEYTDVFNINPKCMLANNQWSVHHYGQTKNAVAGLAISQGKDKSETYKSIMSQTSSRRKDLGYLREKGLVPQNYGEDSNITDLCRNKYSPHDTNQGLEYAGENKYETLIDIFGKNEDTFFGLAHPYYITERNSNPHNVINELIQKSKGYLKATESFHQAYNNKLNMTDVEDFNKKIVRNNKFSELGGRDNHEVNWLDIKYK